MASTAKLKALSVIIILTGKCMHIHIVYEMGTISETSTNE